VNFGDDAAAAWNHAGRITGVSGRGVDAGTRSRSTGPPHAACHDRKRHSLRSWDRSTRRRGVSKRIEPSSRPAVCSRLSAKPAAIAPQVRTNLSQVRTFASPSYDGQPAVYLYIAALEVNVLNCRCDTRSHYASELADWRTGYVGRVVSGACSRPGPALSCAAGNGGVRSTGESPRTARPIRGSQVRGRPDG
jgi:hypothetical protein